MPLKSDFVCIPLTPFLIYFFLLSSCSTRPRNIDEKLDLNKAMTREVANLKMFSVQTEDKQLRFSVQSRKYPKISFIKKLSVVHSVTIDLGTDSPMECLFYPLEINPAASLKKIIEAALESKETIGQVLERQLASFTPGAIGPVPYLRLDTSYLAERDGKKLIGYLKTASAVKGRDSVLCIHNEVGYQKTFSSIFAELVNSFEYLRPEGQSPRPFYTSIMIYKVNEVPLGFSSSYFFKQENGNKVMINKSSKILPASDSQFSALDDMVFEITDPEGNLVYGKFDEEYNSEMTMSLEVNRKNEDRYEVSGTFKGQSINSSWQNKTLKSNYGQSKLMARNFFDLGLKNFSMNIYIPEIDPSKLTNVQLSTKYVNDEGAEISFRIKDKANILSVGPSGAILSIKLEIPPATVSGESIYSHGIFK